MAKSLHEDWILIPLNSFQTEAQKRCTAAAPAPQTLIITPVSESKLHAISGGDLFTQRLTENMANKTNTSCVNR